MTDGAGLTGMTGGRAQVSNLFARRASGSSRTDLVLGVLLAAFVLGLTRHGAHFEPWVDGWLGSLTTTLPALVILARARHHHGAPRRELLLLGAGALLWSLGGIVVVLAAAQDRALPFPSLGDLGFLAFPVLVFAAFASRIRRELSGLRGAVWLDSALAALGATTALAVLLGPLMSSTSGTPLTVVVAAAYPLSDLVLLAVVVGITVSCGLRPGRSWGWLLAGLLVFTAADTIYALRMAHGTYVLGTPLDALWSAGLTMLAAGARWRSVSPVEVETHRMEHGHGPGQGTALAVPAFATVAAIVVLVCGRWGAVPTVATGLATVTLLAAGMRTQMAFRQVVRLYDLGRQARTDSLTGLGNRRALHDRLGLGMRADPPDALAVLLVDLDHFKEVNDALGHHVGDELLRQIGPRLDAVLGSSDLLVRLGGDEFAIVLRSDSTSTPERAAQQVLDELSKPFLLDDVTLSVGASIGIATCPQDATDVNELIRRADVAMYAAKADGGGVRHYEPARDPYTRERLSMIEELRAAIDNDELCVHYQPQCAVATGVVVGVEALVRWQHPVRGLLFPDQFLRLVEQTGLMPALTVAVLERAVQQCVRWRGDGIDVGVSVNVSASSLLDERLAGQVSLLLAKYGLPPCALTLELTESTLMADPDRCRATLSQLSETGVLLSIDDYGTGYCSLSYLQHLPVDELKLDRSFLADLTSGHNPAIVRSTVDLAHALGLRIVAEGVESEPSLELLRQFGCDTAQGFHLSRPRPAHEITRWLHENPQRRPPHPAPSDLVLRRP